MNKVCYTDILLTHFPGYYPQRMVCKETGEDDGYSARNIGDSALDDVFNFFMANLKLVISQNEFHVLGIICIYSSPKVSLDLKNSKSSTNSSSNLNEYIASSNTKTKKFQSQNLIMSYFKHSKHNRIRLTIRSWWKAAYKPQFLKTVYLRAGTPYSQC